METMEKKMSLPEAINKIVSGSHLEREEAKAVMSVIMEGEASPAQIGSLATALRMKGETIQEVTGFAEAMIAKSSKVRTYQQQLLDTCGTGGDGAGTFNISTAAALVASAGGIRVAKHGNRAMSGKSGSADVLEALGVNIALTADEASQCLNEVGICFMFAQVFHQSMKHAAAPRREIGIRTIFNLLGPLTNPARADHQLVGVFDRNKTELVAHVLKELGLKRAIVVGSLDGLDEISISGPTKVTELKDGLISTYEIYPEQLGLRSYPLSEVLGGDAKLNAEIIVNIFKGQKGAYRDIVLANAGACFYVTGHCNSLQEGVKLAAEVIDSGRAYEKLQQLVQFTGEVSHVS